MVFEKLQFVKLHWLTAKKPEGYLQFCVQVFDDDMTPLKGLLKCQVMDH